MVNQPSPPLIYTLNLSTKRADHIMGLSNFHSPAEGMLPILVMNTLMTVVILKNLVKSLVEAVSAAAASRWVAGEEAAPEPGRRVSVGRFKAAERWAAECSVCLSRFEEEEEVGELSCRHFFHRSCLDKWFGNQHYTCPLCRSSH